MTIKVKALKWRNAAMLTAGDSGWLTIRIAETPFGQYRVEKADRHRFRVTLTGQVIANCQPTDAGTAQAAAQADYERRILSAIEPYPSPDMREAMETRREITSMVEMLERLATGDTIHFSQDGDMAWFRKGDGAFVAHTPIIEARRLGYLERKCDDEENYRGTAEYDTISDKGRTALRSLTGAKHEGA